MHLARYDAPGETMTTIANEKILLLVSKNNNSHWDFSCTSMIIESHAMPLSTIFYWHKVYTSSVIVFM